MRRLSSVDHERWGDALRVERLPLVASHLRPELLEEAMSSGLDVLVLAAVLLGAVISALSGLINPVLDYGARVMWRVHGPTGWSQWRPAHYALTDRDHDLIARESSSLDRPIGQSLRGAIVRDRRGLGCAVIQFVVLRDLVDGQSHCSVAEYVSDVFAVGYLRARDAERHMTSFTQSSTARMSA
ncbi:hypothetical protein ACXPWS_10635 [Mycobacterium sp. BMJ-28]